MYKIFCNVCLISIFAGMSILFIYVPNSIGGFIGTPLDCGDPQCDIEDNCLGTLCNDDCKWCPDALPGDRCVADFVECTVAPNPGPATVIPTLNQWGLIFTSLFLGLIAVYVLLRKRTKA